MAEITLSTGKIVLIDDDDYEEISKHRWGEKIYGKHKKFCYAITNIKQDGKQKRVFMHRFIMDAQRGQLVDHINHNTLDNRKSNLRFVDRTQNQCNRVKMPSKFSKYKGVFKSCASKKWKARIKYRGKYYELGYYEDEAIAALAYDLKALNLHGEYALTNYPVETLKKLVGFYIDAEVGE